MIVLSKQSPAAHQVHLSAGQRVSTHSAHHMELTASHLSYFITKDQ